MQDDDANKAFTVDFRAAGNSALVRRGGWADAEPNHTWTIGDDSVLELPRPKLPGTYLLSLEIAPFLWKDKLPVQRLTVTVNNASVGAFEVRAASSMECQIPWAVFQRGETVQINFHHPDAARPSEIKNIPDTRRIAFAFTRVTLRLADTASPEVRAASQRRRRTGATAASVAEAAGVAQVMTSFENLGENCEFGLVQRQCGAEPLGLLRFSSTPLPKLLAALDRRFAELGEPDMVEVQASGNEYMVLDKKYGFLYHPWILVGEALPEAIHRDECKRLPFLARLLIETLESGQKIFVYKGMQPIPEAQIRRLSTSIRSYGPGMLLWVELQDDNHPAGTVETLAPGILKAYIDHFAPGNNAHDLSLDVWVTICQEAYRLWRAELGNLAAG